MTNTIQHQGIVESTNGSHLRVKIVQTSACVSCSIKGHCSSADSQDKLIDIVDSSHSYQVGESVMVIGALSMGVKAVMLAFVAPFILLVVSLFLFMALLNDDLYASLLALSLLVPYYGVLWMSRTRLKQQFSFTIKPIK